MKIPEFDIVESELPLKSQASVKKSPLSENYVLLQQHHKEKARLARERQKQQKDEDKLLAQLGTEIFVLGKCLEEEREKLFAAGLEAEFQRLTIQQEKLLELLKHQGLDLINPTGEPLTLDLLDLVQVLGWDTEEGVTEPKVKETMAPLIYRHQRFVQGGVVRGARPPSPPEHIGAPA
jgi:hypothetical protein